jgi:hypothetical protein
MEFLHQWNISCSSRTTLNSFYFCTLTMQSWSLLSTKYDYCTCKLLIIKFSPQPRVVFHCMNGIWDEMSSMSDKFISK